MPSKKEKLPLSVTHPELAKEADGWDPSTIVAGSHNKLMWKCDKKHTWMAAVQDRSRRGDSCPICAGKKVLIGYNDLATLNPEIAGEAEGWDPRTVTSGSSRKFLWKCSKGHNWIASVVSRTNGSNCSVCNGKQVEVGFNDLESKFPGIAQEASGWDPRTVTPGSNKKLSWRCQLGHNWEAVVHSRTSKNLGCPYCSNQSVLIGFNDFATTHPELLAELVNSDGKDFVAGSFSRKLEWVCAKGHIYVSKPVNRTIRKQGCPICDGKRVLAGFNDLKSTHPPVALEAHNFDPETLSAGSNVRVEWKCPKGHIFEATPHQRTGRNTGCAVCSGDQINVGINDFATTDPELALEAHNWDPKTTTRSSNKKKDWICKFSHTWSASPNSRTNMNSGCPVCTGRKLLSGFNDLATLNPEIASQADGWDPNGVLAGTHKKYAWICDKGHSWSSIVKDRTLRGDGCPSCAKFGFNPNADGFLYFISHPHWEMYQIGITNYPDDRLHTHELLGWKLLEIRGPMDGHLTQQWEAAILRMLKAKGADLSNSEIAGKFDGYSEAWSKSTFDVGSIKDLMRLTEEFENEVKNEPR